jgi:hypothetical protein
MVVIGVTGRFAGRSGASHELSIKESSGLVAAATT